MPEKLPEKILSANEQYEKSAQEVLNVIIDNYINDDGDFNWYESFVINKGPLRDYILERLEKIPKPEWQEWELQLEEFLFTGGVLDKIAKLIKTEPDQLRKIKIIKLYNDIAWGILKETDNHFEVREILKNTNAIAIDQKEGYLLRTYARVRYINNLDWYNSESGLDIDSEFDEGDNIDIRKYHNPKFNELNFEFNEQAINLMNSCSRDYGSPTEIVNSLDAKPLKKVPAPDPYYADESGNIYEGDYIAAELAPGIVGVYTVNGDLIGWHAYDEEIIKTAYDNAIKEEFLNNPNSKSLKFDKVVRPFKLGISETDNDLDRFCQLNENRALYKIISNLYFRDQIEKDFNINFSKFDLRTQFQFLNFIKDADSDKMNKIKKFINQAKDNDNRENRIKSFLSLELDVDSGDRLLEIGQDEVGEQVYANAVFNKYSELVDQAKASKKELLAMFKGKRALSDEEAERISGTILGKAKKLLDDFTEKVRSGENLDEKEILAQLENYSADIIRFTAVFQTAYESGEIELEDMEGVELYSRNSEHLSDGEKEMIREVIRNNYVKPEQQKDILEKVEASFANKNMTRWHLLTRQAKDRKELASCIRFDDLNDEEVYAATFNVSNPYRGSKLGDAMFREVMAEMAKLKRVRGIAEIGKLVSDYYINKGGFNIIGIETNKKTGIDYYRIERQDVENEFLAGKNVAVSERELLAGFDQSKTIDDHLRVGRYRFVLHLRKGSGEERAAIDRAEDGGYVISKIMSDPMNKDQSYYLFEIRPVIETMKRAA